MRINSNLTKLAAGLALFASSFAANAQLNVFACEPEYAALAQSLAPNADIYSATTAMQDPHQVQARPSLIAKMRQADLVVCAGADLEIGWLPMLQMKASNSKVRSTENGLFYAADHTDTLDKLENVDRSMGDVHAKGNPHLHWDPVKLLEVAKGLTEKLIQQDSANKAQYEQAYADFSQQWQAKIPQWQAQAKAFEGKKVIAYHSSFRYLFNWVGIEQVADLEPKPGLAPTSSHLASLLTRAEQGDVSGIIVASYHDERGAKWLGDRTQLPVITLPMSVGGNDQSVDLISLYDSALALLARMK